jgi:hypothetical protein
LIGDVDNPTKRVQQQPLAKSLPTRALVDRQTPDQGNRQRVPRQLRTQQAVAWVDSMSAMLKV